MRFLVCRDQYVGLVFNSDSSLNQQLTGKHNALIGNIILILSQPVFALSPYLKLLA